MAGYIGNKSSVVSSGAERKFKFTITETTTTLSNLAYTRDLVHVFHNGVRLVDGTDYTATNGTSITLTNAAENGDEVVVISYASFQPSDTVSASLGGFFEGNVTVNADLTVSGNTDINGGTIDGTVIGGSTPAAISGTTGAFSGNLTVDTNTLFVDAATNEVGIGTTAPDGPLTVQLAASSNTSWSMALEGFNTAQLSHTISDSTSVRRKLSAIEGFVGSNDVSNFQGGLIFKTTPAAGSPTERVRIDASGNVGIGTNATNRLALTYDQFSGLATVGPNSTGGSTALSFGTSLSGSYAERMRIDSSGKVGIGTSSPDYLLTLQSGDAAISMKDAGGTTRAYIGVAGGFGSAPTGALRIRSDQGGIVFGYQGTEQMRLDSAGRVTKPYQPAFHAIRTNHVTSTGTIVFDSKTFDVGNNYNNTTGIFTAPVAGKYLITFGTLLWNMGYASSALLHINGISLGSAFGTYGQFTGSYAGQGASAVISLNAADYVYIYFLHYGTNLHSGYTFWSGCLLG